MSTTALVYGLAITGEAVARALARPRLRVSSSPTTRPTTPRSAAAAAVGADLIAAPTRGTLDELVATCDIVCPAPGVPETHPVIAAAVASGMPIRTEIDLAYEWEQQRAGGPRPMLAVTGTDGKTTTTLMAAAMLRCAGLKAGGGRQHRGAAGRRARRPTSMCSSSSAAASGWPGSTTSAPRPRCG